MVLAAAKAAKAVALAALTAAAAKAAKAVALAGLTAAAAKAVKEAKTVALVATAVALTVTAVACPSKSENLGGQRYDRTPSQ